METLKDFGRGLGASLSRPALLALAWAYGACLAVGLAFTILAYRFVAGTVSNSAMAGELRQGQTADWMVDLIGTPGTSSSVRLTMTAAILFVVVYLVLTVFFSGGVVAKVRTALGLAGPERFLESSARYIGPMALVASAEVVAVVVLAIVFVVATYAGGLFGARPAIAWPLLALSAFTFALVTSVFDYARIRLVACEDRAVLAALGGAFRFVGRRALPVVALTVLNGVVALAALWLLVWVHALVPLDTGAGLLLGIVVGQIGILGRLWARVAAYATETALWARVSDMA